MKRYKLGEIAEIYNGSTPASTKPEYYGGDIIWITPKDLSDQGTKYIDHGERSITQAGYDSCSTTLIPAGNILMSSRAPIGLLAINKVDCCTNQGFKNIVVNKKIADTEYIYYFLMQNIESIKRLSGGTTFQEVSKKTLEQCEFEIPDLSEQQRIAKILSTIDAKIELNKKISRELEAMAKELYDYWFVQFDFPNEQGKPYKSSGGKMVWNETLKREIPEGWEVKNISSFIECEISGDWGESELDGKYTSKVWCIRGCDIDNMIKLPIRYITPRNESKTLKRNDFVIEISGGSPTQSTGRIALISEEIITRFEQKIICSNFCKGIRIKNQNYISFFLYMWNMFYKNGIFFNYEGKTSGIKNFQFDIFINNQWFFPPERLAKKYNDYIMKIKRYVEGNATESNRLYNLRDQLLPLLMNGQVRVSQS